MARIRIETLRIDEALWDSGSPTRRAEWQGAIRDFLDESDLALPGSTAEHDVRAHLQLSEELIGLELAAAGKMQILRAELQPLIDDYLQICADLAGLGHASPRYEALDIAKRLAHDEAGELIQRLAQPIQMPLQTARRLFTLIVTVIADTTALASSSTPRATVSLLAERHAKLSS